MVKYVTKPATPLLRFGKADTWKLADALQGAHVFGGTGSGKTSGSGKALAEAYLKAGMGGLVLCAKPDEAELWVNYAKACGRENNVILFRPDQGTRFNFLEYEMALGAGGVDNVVALLMKVVDLASPRMGGADGENEFWRNAIQEMLANTIGALYHAWGTVRLPDVFKIVQDGPKSPANFADERWKAASFLYKTLNKMAGDPVVPIREHDGRVIADYWRYTFAGADQKTRANVHITFTSKLSPLMRGDIYDMLCTSTNVVPELAHEGAIIIVDVPSMQFREVGILLQKVWKYMFQRAAERRVVNGGTRPLFLWADEAHVFIDEYDAEFQSMARGRKVATVYLSQNVDAYVQKIGGANAMAIMHGLIGQFQTQIFHANTSANTNEYASNMIGRSIQIRSSQSSGTTEGKSASTSRGRSKEHAWGEALPSNESNRSVGVESGENFGFSDSLTYSQQMELEVEPGDFARNLAKGGPDWDYKVDGFVCMASGRFKGNRNRNWTKVQFSQR